MKKFIESFFSLSLRAGSFLLRLTLSALTLLPRRLTTTDFFSSLLTFYFFSQFESNPKTTQYLFEEDRPGSSVGKAKKLWLLQVVHTLETENNNHIRKAFKYLVSHDISLRRDISMHSQNKSSFSHLSPLLLFCCYPNEKTTKKTLSSTRCRTLLLWLFCAHLSGVC